MEKQLKQISKLMSLVLRHQPQVIGLHLNEHGWANVDELIEKINQKGIRMDTETLRQIVETNDKQRFSFSEDQSMIRANQGHSIEVELNLATATAPDILYHGTALQFLDNILKEGLNKQKRQHVHLSWQIETAKAVGSRHGKPVILQVNAKQMQQDGFVFYLSANNVWLVDAVPVQYLTPANI